MANNSTGNYTFYPKFSEYVNIYHGVIKVWIADGTAANPGTPGKLYAEYSDDRIQELGYVSDYETAKQYFADLGIDLTYDQWVELLARTPENAKRSEAWAIGKQAGQPVPSTDETYNNNSKYWAEQAKSYSDGKGLNEQDIRPTDNAEYYKNEAKNWVGSTSDHASATDNAIYWKNQAKLWANNGTDGDVPSETNNAKAYANKAMDNNRQSESWAKGTRDGQPDTIRPNASTDNALYYSEIAKLWANNGTDGNTPGPNNNAKKYSERSNEYEMQSESWAKGTRNGTQDIIRPNAATDNAKAYSQYSEAKSNESEDYSLQSESWAKGTRNGSPDSVRQGAAMDNSRYYSMQSENYAQNSETSAYNSSVSAYNSAIAQQRSEVAASNSERSAQNSNISAQNSEESNLEAESWAKGTRNGQPDSVRQNADKDNASYYTKQSKLWANFGADGDNPAADNNAKYYSKQAGLSATAAGASEASSAISAATAVSKAGEAETSAQTAAISEENSEAWAVGKRKGTDVQSTDETYHNNSKYFAGEAYLSRSAAADSESNAEAWAVGQRGGLDVPTIDDTYNNNSKYYAVRAKTHAETAVASETIATDAKNKAIAAVNKGPYISASTRNWVTWDSSIGEWVDTGVDARGLEGRQGPQGEPGRDAIAIEVKDQEIAFEIDENGHLILVYGSTEQPNYYINDEGHLIYEF